MDPLTIVTVIRGLESQLTGLLGPAPAAGYVRARAAIAISDCAITRATEYYQQQKSVGNRQAAGYANTIPDPAALIKMIHQTALLDGPGLDLQSITAQWDLLGGKLECFGIDLAGPTEADAPAGASDWLTIAQMAASAAPLAQAVQAYWRSQAVNEPTAAAAATELDFHFRRGGFSRAGDRQLIANPYFAWGPQDAANLWYRGAVDGNGYSAILNAAGMSNAQDYAFQTALSVVLPPPPSIIGWASAGRLDDGLAGKWGLDDGGSGLAMARFISNAQGFGFPGPPLANTPAGNTDWVTLAYRAERPTIGVSQAIEMQRRFRPGLADPLASVVDGVPAWSAEDTSDMIALEGYSGVQAQYLAGLVTEPINVRIIQTVILEALKHPAVAAAAQAAYPDGTDWVVGAYLDHGFSPAVAQLAADGIRAKAADEYNAELIENQKALRKQARDQAAKSYAAGTLMTDAAIAGMTDEFFTPGMAVQLLNIIDAEVKAAQTENVVGVIRESYLSGKITGDQVIVQLDLAGVTPARQVIYLQEWVWSKTDKVRTLETSQILQALKAGLMTPAIATLRLTNLGWTGTDALVEIAQVEQEISNAQAKSAQTAASKLSASEARATRAADVAAKAAAAASAKAAKEAAKTADEVALAAAEQAKAANTYGGKANADLDDYTKALAAGDVAKQNEYIDKAAAAYATWLISQAKLRQESPDVEKAIGPGSTASIPVPPAGA
jgi:hypothetical protein